MNTCEPNMHLSNNTEESSILAPSELLVLREEKLSLKHTAEAAFAAAFLVNAQANAIRLDVRREKKLFGLYSTEVLFIEKGPNRSEWPQYSIESKIVEIVNKEPAKVSDIVCMILNKKTKDADEHTLDIIKAGLRDRGLLEVEKVKYLKVLTAHEYKLPSRTQELLERISISPLREVFSNAQRQPHVWEILVKQIRSGINLCTEGPDLDYDSRD